MKESSLSRIVLSIIIIALLTQASVLAQRSVWATAYYAGWQQGYNNTGYMPAEAIDMTAVTHIVHFSIVPRSDGSLDDASNSVTAFNAQKIVSHAHAAGKKVIISIGGWATETAFRGATSSANRSRFISNLVSLMTTRGYDGIDIDWETLTSGDAAQYTTFIRELRSAMNAVSPRPLLTAATAWQPSILAQVQAEFDQINIMSYDLAGAWPGWVTWHNAALYDGGFNFPSTSKPVPSIEGMVTSFISAGVPAEKLGIGIDFYGYIWNGGNGTPNGGATDPRQAWTTAPSVQANVSYSTIMKNYYQPQYYRFDNAAQVSYLSIDNAGSTNDKFISYDDAVTSAKKVEYARSRGIGGVIIWELGGGYRPELPAGQRDPLLQAVKQALVGSGPVDATPPSVSFTFPSVGSVLSSIVSVGVNASDNVGVTGVRLFVDGTQVGGEDPSSPFSFSWNSASVGDGAHTLTVTARDAAGNTASASVAISVLNLIQDLIPPVVSLTTPGNGSAVSGTVTLAASASDNVGVVGVRFQVNGADLGSELTSAPYSVSWSSSSVPNGSYAITARARDAAGNQSNASITVTVSNTVTEPPPPTAGFTQVALDAFNRANARPVSGSGWTQLLNQPGSGTMEIVSDQIQPYNASGSNNAGGVAWSTALQNGNGVSLRISRKAGTNVNSTLFLYLRMSSKDLSTADGYRLRYLENPSGTDVLSIQRVTNGTTAFDVASVSKEVNNGDKLTFVTRDDATATMDVYVNGVKVLSTVDNAYNASTWYAWVRAFVLPTVPRFDDFEVVSVSSQTAALPSVPAQQSPSNAATGVAVPATFAWGAAQGAESYGIQVSQSSAFTSTLIDRSGLTAATYSSTSLPAGTTLYWRVRAANAAGQSAWSSTWSFATKPAPDTTRPVASISSPASGQTVSGTVSILVGATDNVGVAGVQVRIDGTNAGAELTAVPYQVAWNTQTASDGAHTISAIVRDAAGNSTTVSVNVGVSNTVAVPAGTPIAADGLVAPWTNASWGATVNFTSTETVRSGNASIKVNQNAWGGLSVHSGSWGNPVAVTTSGYSAVEFAIHGGPSGVRVSVLLENDVHASFPRVSLGTVAANVWKVFSVPMSSLNPGGHVVHRLDILEESGSARTYFVDDVRFVGSGSGSASAQSLSADEGEPIEPSAFTLGQNYPNPFNPTTSIAFSLKTDAHARVEVFNVVGQRVAMLVDGVRSAGTHTVQFNATELPSGLYFCRLTALGADGTELFRVTRRMSLLK